MAVFDAQSNRRIIKSVLATEGMVRPGVSRARNRRPVRSTAVYGGIGITATVITEFNEISLRAGKGNVQRYKLGENDIMEPVGDAIEVYNMAREVAAAKWVQWKVDDEGIRWLDVELCDVALASTAATAQTVADITDGGIFSDEFSTEFG